MKRMTLAALTIAAFVAIPSAAHAQDVRAQQRAERRQQMMERRAETQPQLSQRRTERLQRLLERRPELKERIERRIAAGKRVQPLARKLMLERRLKSRKPELFERLDLDKDGRLSSEELRQRRRIGRT